MWLQKEGRKKRTVKKHFLYILLSCLMVVSLAVASCGGGETNEEEETVTYDDPLTPKYGGIHNRIRTADWSTWDYAAQSDMFIAAMMGEELLGGDWANGPAGTNQNDWTCGFGGFIDTLVGKLAESWEITDTETLVYHIRPGVHWWDKAPANGREVTAEDIAWNIERNFSSPMAFNYNHYTTSSKAPLSAKAIDESTVEVKVKPEWQGIMAEVVGDHLWTICPDVVEANGGEPITEWAQFIGTGPYMITDYMTGSYITYERNPNYWQMDPLHPENRLPYADGIKELIIGDASTQQAAFTTGQVDVISTTWMTVSGYEEVDLLKSQHPELLVKNYASSATFMVWPRLDNEDLPFSDVRIRQAMNMAINQQELVDDYYGGNADLLAWPYLNVPLFDAIYTPLEEQPQIVQDMFGHNVEQAKELMAAAGYPDGFKFKVDCTGTQVDVLSIIKEYLKDINVELEINTLEFSIYMSEWMGGTYEQAFYGSDYLVKPQEMMCMIEGSTYNYSRVSDARIQAAYKTITENQGKNDAKVIETLKEIAPYELELAVPLYLPSAHSFSVWWPWFQNFYGAVGGGGNANNDDYLPYFWVDASMKTAMGYAD